MALYRTGTAAMDAQGVITGTGTKWREPLSLIRTGATIVFLTSPLKLAVISDIVSDTEMKAIQTDGELVENGNYVILLNDSLTVDGMAQDVAETLRYYQSKETVIEEAIEFLKNFDIKQFKDLIKQAVDSAAGAKQSETNAAQSAQMALELKNQTEQLKSDTNQIKQETQSIKDGAVTEINNAKDSAIQQIGSSKDSALHEMNVVKQETFDARDEAELARDTANSHASDANNAKAGAETARDEARQWAQQVQPENLLHKDQNLNDLADKKKSRKSLEVDRVVQAETSTSLGWIGGYRLSINSSGYWGAINGSNEWTPLGIAQGGTGSQTSRGACDNIGAMSVNVDGLKMDNPYLKSGIIYFGDGSHAGGSGAPFNYAHVLSLSERNGTVGNWTQVAFPVLVDAAPKIRRRNAVPPLISEWFTFVVQGLNATVDTNGFWKVASPIIKLMGDGTIETNTQSNGATAVRVGRGVYEISGVLGFNSNPEWGGIDGGFVIPNNNNGLPLLWVDYEIKEDGGIIVKTYHRTHDNVPEFAKNEIEGFANGDPIDIPAGRWLDLRVEMPSDSECNKIIEESLRSYEENLNINKK